MSGAIGPGDFVEAVHRGEPVNEGGAFRPGEICVVEEVGEDHSGPYLNCVGKPRPADMGYFVRGWPASSFRPIYRPRADFIESLKAPPQHVRESEDA